jgi:ubiquinol-cytochrome c reductase cytochrome b subunit
VVKFYLKNAGSISEGRRREMTFMKAVKSIAIAALALVMAAPAVAAEDSSRGIELLNSLGCKGCHRINGQGGTLGPALDGVGKRLDEQRIRRQLLDPKSVNPGSVMPSFGHLPEQDINTLVDYLGDIK